MFDSIGLSSEVNIKETEKQRNLPPNLRFIVGTIIDINQIHNIWRETYIRRNSVGSWIDDNHRRTVIKFINGRSHYYFRVSPKEIWKAIKDENYEAQEDIKDDTIE